MQDMTRGLAAGLLRHRYGPERPGLCRDGAASFLDELLPVLIPALGDRRFADEAALVETLKGLVERLERLIYCVLPAPATLEAAEAKARAWFGALAGVERILADDAAFIAGADPAATGVAEVEACYPGFYAIAVHRLAHVLVGLGVPFLPRLLAEIAHSRTGIDIHPAATIGHPFFIDHGTGVVVGESAVIGQRVKIYQGVTLGALSVSKAARGTKRHPTVEDDVVIYAGATVLGGTTVIGRGAVIGGGVWLTDSVPPGARVFNRAKGEVKSAHAD